MISIPDKIRICILILFFYALLFVNALNKSYGNNGDISIPDSTERQVDATPPVSDDFAATDDNPVIGFYDITGGSPYHCGSVINLRAFNHDRAGGYITPGFSVFIDIDGKTNSENYITFFINDEFVQRFPIGSFPGLDRFWGEYLPPNDVWSFEWCDIVPDGQFPYQTYDHAAWTKTGSGVLNHNDGTECNKIVIGALTGIATFSGPGVTNNKNGTGVFNAADAGVGIHEITYCWDNEAGFSGCASQTIEVVPPFANAGTDKNICKGDTITIGSQHTASGGAGNYIYRWSPTEGLDDPNCANPEASPQYTTNYTVTITDAAGSGCSAIDRVTVFVHENPQVDIPDNEVVLCADSVFAIDATVSGNSSQITETIWTGDNQYLSDTAIYNPQFHTKQHGSYKLQLTVYDEKGCINSDSLKINVLQKPEIFLGTDTAICTGDTLYVSPGKGFKQYLWNTGSAFDSIPVSKKGKYSVLVTNDNNCTTSDTIAVGILPLPEIDIGNDTIACIGDSLSINAEANASYGVKDNSHNVPRKYLWNTGDTTAAIFVKNAGSYQVMVTDSNQCRNSDTIQIDFTMPPEIDLGKDTAICNGRQLFLSATCDNCYSLWNNSIKAPEIVADTTGLYTVITTNAYGCATEDSLYLTINNLPIVELGKDKTICSGEEITLSVDDSYAAYKWHDGYTLPIRSVDTQGIYSVVVTDENGCRNKDSVEVKVTPQPEINLGNDTTICSDETIVLDAGEQFVTYQWSTGSSEPQIVISQAGAYTLKVMYDNPNCSAMDTIQVFTHTAPDIFLGNDTSICENQQLILDAGSDFVDYEWNTGEVSQSITTFLPGVYHVNAMDALGCRSGDTIIVKTNPIPFVDLGNTVTICQGEMHTFDATNSFEAYQWSDGSVESKLTTHEAGIYYVDITNFYGCTARYYAELQILPVPDISLGNDTVICKGETITFNAGNFIDYQWNNKESGQFYTTATDTLLHVRVFDGSCYNSDTIKITINQPKPVTLGSDTTICLHDTLRLNAGNGFKQYHWSTGQTSDAIDVYQPNEYAIHTLDSNGCASSDAVQVMVHEPAAINFDDSISICPGDSTVLQPANPFVHYQWSDGSIHPELIVKEQGVYSLTANDSFGCKVSDSVEIIVHHVAVLNLGGDTAVCSGDSLRLDAGDDYADYLWHNGNQKKYFFAKQSGLYSIEVSDENHCKQTDTIKLTVHELPEIELGTDTALCVGEQHVIEAPSGMRDYHWNSGAKNQILYIDSSGIYSVKITDTNGCQNEDTIQIAFIKPLPVSLGEDTVICENTIIRLDAGVDADKYQWSNGDTTRFIQVKNPATYFITAIDTNGCSATDSINVSLFPSPHIEKVVTKSPSCYGMHNANIHITGNTGQIYSINDSVFSSSGMFSGLKAGGYELYIKDSNQCVSLYDTIRILQPTKLQVEVNSRNAACFGENSGSIIAKAKGGNGDYVFSLNNIENKIGIFDNLSAGRYRITVSDAKSCMSDTLIQINEPEKIAIHSVKHSDLQCFGDKSGFIMIDATGGIHPLFYSIDGGENFKQNNGQFSELQRGVFQVVIKDNNQCVYFGDTVILNQPPEIKIDSLEAQGVSCNGIPDGSLTITASGGTGNLLFTLNDSLAQYQSHFIDLPAGWYLLQISDNNNCSVYDTISVENSDEFCLDIPSAFSPNGDGINDTWQIDGLQYFPNAIIEIYDRWSNMIFRSEGTYKPWNGRLNGKKLANDSFYYAIFLKPYSKPVIGHVTLVTD